MKIVDAMKNVFQVRGKDYGFVVEFLYRFVESLKSITVEGLNAVF